MKLNDGTELNIVFKKIYNYY